MTWKIYEGDIEVTWVWNKPSSGLRRCGLCDRRRPLHYPKECLTMSPVCHPCLFCGKEEQDHIREDCPMKGDLSQAKDVTELFHQCIQFQQSPFVSENLLHMSGVGYHQWPCSKVPGFQDHVHRGRMGSPTSTFGYGGRERTPEVLLLRPRMTPSLPWRL